MANDADHASWFSDDELHLCPRCGKRTLIPQSSDQPLAVCLSCGVVDVAADPSADTA